MLSNDFDGCHLLTLTADAWKESTHAPPSVSIVSAGPKILNVSKSNLSEQTPERKDINIHFVQKTVFYRVSHKFVNALFC